MMDACGVWGAEDETDAEGEEVEGNGRWKYSLRSDEKADRSSGEMKVEFHIDLS